MCLHHISKFARHILGRGHFDQCSLLPPSRSAGAQGPCGVIVIWLIARRVHHCLNQVAILQMLCSLLGCGGDNYLHICRKLLRGQAWLLPEIR
jgi:hypothetical protein